MEFDFDTTYQVKVEGYTYIIAPEGNFWRVYHRKTGGKTYITDQRHKTLDSAKEHVVILARYTPIDKVSDPNELTTPFTSDDNPPRADGGQNEL